jgi:hypothetical protein
MFVAMMCDFGFWTEAAVQSSYVLVPTLRVVNAGFAAPAAGDREAIPVSSLIQLFAGGAHGELAVFDAFRADEFVGQGFDDVALPFQHQYFEAVVGI